MSLWVNGWASIASLAAGALLSGYLDKPAPALCSDVITQISVPSSDVRRSTQSDVRVYTLEGKLGEDHL